jgi:hypothetical protein
LKETIAKLTGSCMCDAVQYEIHGELRDVIACHCNACRKFSGHFSAATAVLPERLKLLNQEGLRWYRSSANAQRGFCCRCGSALFWKPESGEHISIFAGTIEGQTKLRVASHICLEDKGDYYDVNSDC